MVVINPFNVVSWSSNLDRCPFLLQDSANSSQGAADFLAVNPAGTSYLSLRVSLFHNYQYAPCEVVELCKVFSQGPVLSSSSIYSSLCMMLLLLCLSLSYREL